MRLERGRKEDAVVWALEALSDGTVVSGDSCGRVQVSIQSNHGADENLGAFAHDR